MLTELQQRKLTKFFWMYDANEDGVLGYQDFENFAKRIAGLQNLGLRSPKYIVLKDKVDQLWKALKSGADTSHNHQVSLEEWLTYYSQVLDNQQQYQDEIRHLMELVFEVFDADGDGHVSQAEWASLLKGFNVSPVYAPTIFKQLDLNQDGGLTRDKMLQLIDDFFHSDQPDAGANFMFGPY